MTYHKNTSVHAHEALAFIDTNAGRYDAQTLPDAIRSAFGAEARFHACSATGMSPEALLAFLLQKEKIVLHGGRFHLNRANICTH
ncbi:MAG: YecH family protein [Opitutales bacterium]|nr:YecH family protein [Opitutales bacterium]